MNEPDAPNFGGVPGTAGCDPRKARVVFVQAPYEGSVSYGGGTAAGPAALLEASRQVETHDEETGVDLQDLSFALGPVVEPKRDEDPASYAARVQAAVREVMERGGVPFTLGGEHSVTIGAVRAVRERHPGAHVLSIDAHADLQICRSTSLPALTKYTWAQGSPSASFPMASRSRFLGLSKTTLCLSWTFLTA
jgi:agmatinase